MITHLAARDRNWEGLWTREIVFSRGRSGRAVPGDPKTVTRWAAAGRISSIRTPGGHRRFRESEVRALLDGEMDQESSA